MPACFQAVRHQLQDHHAWGTVRDSVSPHGPCAHWNLGRGRTGTFVNFGLIWLDAPIAKNVPIGNTLATFHADDRDGCGIGDFWHRPAEHIVWRSLIYAGSRIIGHEEAERVGFSLTVGWLSDGEEKFTLHAWAPHAKDTTRQPNLLFSNTETIPMFQFGSDH